MEITIGQILIFISSLLLSGNLFFVKRLVDKIDETNEQRIKDHAAVSELFREVSGVTFQLREIKQEIKDLRRIEIDVAVLKQTNKNESLKS